MRNGIPLMLGEDVYKNRVACTKNSEHSPVLEIDTWDITVAVWFQSFISNFTVNMYDHQDRQGNVQTKHMCSTTPVGEGSTR